MYLILIIYNYTTKYKKLLDISQKYININKNFESYYVKFEKNLNNPIELKDNFILIKGEERYLNITIKTVLALDYLINTLNKKYTHIIRTNISTIINYNHLEKELKNIPDKNVYTGGLIGTLYKIDKPAGIINDKYFGLKYISGTSIILSYDIVLNLIKNINNLDHSVVDDVSIGIFIRNNYKEIYDNLNKFKFNIIGFNPPLNKNILNNMDSLKDKSFIRTTICQKINQIELFNKITNYLFN